MKRRTFLNRTAAGLTTLAGWSMAERALGRTIQTGREAPPADSYHPPEWLRYMRPIYFEGYAPPLHPPQPKHFDARQIVEVAQSLGGDTLRFQPVSYRSAYPSKVFPVYPEFAGRDLIDEISRECRRVGMHLYCYCMMTGGMDAAVIDDPRYAAFVLRGPDGKPPRISTGYGNGEEVVQDHTGDAYRQAMRQQARELCAHDIDGVYYDAPSGYREICFCDPCREGFKKFSGMDLDVLRDVRALARPPENANMKAISIWYDWANKLTDEDLVDLRRIIHGSGKFMLCHNGGTWRPGSFHAQYRYSDGFMVEYSDEFYQRLMRALMGSSMARPRKQLAQTYMGSYDVASNGHPTHDHPSSAHLMNLEDGDEIRMEGFADLAAGNVPLYAVMNRMLYGLGEGSAEPVKEVYSLMRRAEPILKDNVPVSYLSLVLTAESLEMFRTRRRSWNVQMSEGFALAMLDERIAFDVVPNLEMTPEWLKGQRAIALCGASAVTDEDARILADWVRNGGALLATYDSGLFQDKGEMRQDGGALREILGVEMTAEAPRGQADTFYRVTRTHPALGDYHEGKVVMGDGMLMRVTPRPGATVLAEAVNMEKEEVLGPAIVANQYGKGKTLYVGGSIEAHYAVSRVVPLRRMLASMVRYLAGDAPMPFSLTAPRGVYGVLRRPVNGDLVLWLIANVGFKDAAVGRMRQEYVPVSNVEVKIRVPQGKHVKSVHMVRSDKSVPFNMSGEYAVLTVPHLHIAELVHVALA